MFSRILSAFILCFLFVVGLALFFPVIGQPSFRENTEVAAGFNERAFKEIKEGDSIDSVLAKLGKPLEVKLSKSVRVGIQSLDGSGVKYEDSIPNPIWHYTRSRKFCDGPGYIIRYFAVRDGIVIAKVSLLEF